MIHRSLRIRLPLLCTSFLTLAWALASPAAASARGLSVEDRVAAQRAIEQVYWNHRIWPKENPGPKPALSAVMPDGALRAKVEDYLRKSTALEMLWKRPITEEQLQAEMDRMAAHSRVPEVLRELFEALGNDPLVIAETLARQALADRLLRSWYANDERFHGENEQEAQAARDACRAVACMRSMGGKYHETTWRKQNGEIDLPVDRAVRLDPEEWTERLERLAQKLGGTSESLRTLHTSDLEETGEGFLVTAVLAQSHDEVTTATVVWPKVPFDDWWAAEHESFGPDLAASYGSFELPMTSQGGCVDDTWSPTLTNLPDQREIHTAVWTGTEMIVWGGITGGSDGYSLATGGRYNPSTDTWTATSTGANVPGSRSSHTAVWTGTEMIIWGGGPSTSQDVPESLTQEGGRYNPSTDTWTPTSSGINTPAARFVHTAVWTGTQMIIWGGFAGSNALKTGGRYDPSSDTWLATSTGANVPAARHNHAAVWTGTLMIVWGGSTEIAMLNTGGRYDPSSDTWTATSVGANVPSVRFYPTAVWTGTEMIVWGGAYSDAFVSYVMNTGGRYNPSSDTWLATSTGANVPSARYRHTVVWTGAEMIVWGGNIFGGAYFNSGGRYDPSSDTWVATSTGANVPPGRYLHTAVWTGAEMIVWGGFRSPGDLNSGGRYDPASNSWVAISTDAGVAAARRQHTAVWTGTEMIVWGGNIGATYLNTGGRYNALTDTWTATSTGANLPPGRYLHTAVWTGTEMIVWGGSGNGGAFNTGGRYSPSSDTWTATSTGANVPTGRTSHTAVWTGTEMIVWGGVSGLQTNTGGRYSPSSDTWTATSAGVGVPAERSIHTAVWTGTEMIVWGGYYSFPFPMGTSFNSGGRYDPSTDAWVPTSTGANVPSGRYGPTAVWTGTEMIVWGGLPVGQNWVNTGGRYDPSANTWVTTSTGGNVPQGRWRHTAVWTGAEMIVWGGNAWDPFNSGGRYDPSTNAWVPTSTGTNVPEARLQHSAVWTGDRMIVWGGDPITATGGLYCAICASPATWYEDQDGDGYGVSTATQLACTRPPGFAASAGDCNDTSAAQFPGNPEICDGLDNNCDQQVDEGLGQSGVLVLSLDASETNAELSWTEVLGGTGYDVVYGSLLPLLASGGDFTTATADCLENGTSLTSLIHEATPDTGEGYWYLVRATGCGETYDGGGAQVDSRDDEILASGNGCP